MPTPAPITSAPAAPAAPAAPGARSRRRPWPARAGSFLFGLLVALNPFTLFLGPVFQRDIRTLGRKPSTYWTRGLYTLGLLGFTTLFYLGLASTAESYRGAARVQEFQTMAPTIATALGWFQLVAAFLIAPTLTGPLICDEKRNRTLSALATSPLTSGHIVCAGLAGRLVQMAILLLLAAPLLLALRAFGGLDAGFVLAITAINVTTAILAGALGVWGSVHAKRPWAATGFALTYSAVLCFGPPLLLVLTMAFPRLGLAWLGTASLYLSPFMALTTVTVPGIRAGPFAGIGDLWRVHCLLNLVEAALVLAIASFQLRRVLLREAAEAPPVAQAGRGRAAPADAAPGSPPRPLRVRLHDALLAWRRHRPARVLVFTLGFVVPTVFFLTGAFADSDRFLKDLIQVAVVDRLGPDFIAWYERVEGPDYTPSIAMIIAAECIVVSLAFLAPMRIVTRVVGDAPVLWREARLAAFGAPRVLLLAGMGLGLVIALCYTHQGLGEMGTTVFMTILLSVVACLHCATAGGASIASEVQSRAWHVLLTTPLSPAAILRGKILGIILRAWPLAALVLVHYVLAMVWGRFNPLGVILVAAIVFSGMVFVTTLGVTLSLFFKRPTPPSISALLICLTLWLLTPMVVSILSEITRAGRTGERLLSLVVAASPVPMAVIAITGTFTQRGMLAGFEMPHGRTDLSEFLIYAGLGCAALLAVSAILLRAAEAQFARIVARDR